MTKDTKRSRYEAPDVGAMVGRMLRALARRAAEGDPEAIEQLVQLGPILSEQTAAAGAGLHAFGYSWTEVGDAMGVSRQAARQRCSGTACRESS